MKKILTFLIVALLSGCAALYHKSVYLIDFRKYTEAGFVISPATSGFSYSPVGVLSMEIVDGKQQTVTSLSDSFHDEKTNTFMSKKKYIRTYGRRLLILSTVAVMPRKPTSWMKWSKRLRS